MPNSSSTVVVDSSTTTNSPAAWGYGYVWATGKRAAYYEIQNTGSDTLDFTRVGFWILGEGEWDGCNELWINDGLVWQSEFDDPQQFSFHRGTDSVIGSGINPSSNGPDQMCDAFWRWFPSAITPLNFSRMAYYGIFRKQPIENQTNTHQNDPTQWTDIAPVGLWRGLRVRIFDDEGNQTGYAFSTNPIWQLVDMDLRRRLFPEYNISLTGGADPIPDAVRARFNWGDIYASATYCNQLIPTAFGPRPRFSSSCAFNQQTTLTACKEQVLKVCRGYTREYAGQISYLIDQPRSSVLTFTRAHVMPGSFAPSDKTASQQGNSFQAKFRDLLVPASAQITSITCSAPGQNPVVTTAAPHCFNAGDVIFQGGTGTNYDGQWTVYSVPTGASVTQYTLISKGSNYPLNVGDTGGVAGLAYSRFKERAPVFNHQNNQYARGAVGVGLPRQLNLVPVSYDLAVCTFDQASRIVRYEKDRALGLDISPYVVPPALTFRCPAYAIDGAGSGAVARQIQPGDVVTLDSTASWAYQGEYEVIKRVDHPYTGKPVNSGNSLTLKADAGGGEMELTLGTFNEAVMYDYTDPSSAGWSNVPGSDPGNNGDYTPIDLIDGGQLAFISGSVVSGGVFQLPSSGFTASNVIAWCSPQGYVEKGYTMDVISLCNVEEATLQCALDYEDSSDDFWNGDLNIAAAAWIGSSAAASLSTVGLDDTMTFNWLACTLDGGENIVIGQGNVLDGTQLVLPAGFTWDQCFAIAMPQEASPSGNNADGFGGYVDSGGVVHLRFSNTSESWPGYAQVLVWAWQNNSGGVTTQTTGGANWMLYSTPAGYTLGVGMGTFADGSTMGLPTAAGAAGSLQTMATPHSFTDGGTAAHGVGACYVDDTNIVHMYFSNGSANWSGQADVFALFYEPTSGSGSSTGGIGVTVTPAGMWVAPEGTIQFTASVTGTSNTAVNWFVDGVAGGNSTIGTIDDTGNYTAPDADGTHLITAVSQANDAAQGWVLIQVGTGSGSGGTDTIGITISPHSANIGPGVQQQFAATVTGTTDTSVTWSVNGIAGGSEAVGYVDGTGLYTAPTASGVYTVTATSSAADGISVSAMAIVGSPGGGEYGD